MPELQANGSDDPNSTAAVRLQLAEIVVNAYRLHSVWLGLFLTVACSLFLTGCQSLSAGGSGGGGGGSVVVGTSSLNFGAVAVGSSKTLADTLSNNTTSSATISSITGSSSDLQILGITPPLVLGAGQSVPFSVKFQVLATETLSRTISFLGANSAVLVSVTASGNSAPPGQLSPNPSSVAFGSVKVGSSRTNNVTLSNSGGTDLTVNQATLSGAGFSTSNLALPLTLHAGGTASLSVTFAPTGSGSFTGNVTFSTSASSNVVLPLSGTGVAPGQLSANPSSLIFGSVQVGNSSSQSGTLTNTGCTPVTISQANVSSTGFTLSGLALPLTLGTGESATFSVVFAPQSAGSANGNLAFASDASNPAMNLPLSGNTALVAITVNPNNATLVVGSTQQFIANVTGTSKTAVAWTVSGAGCIGVACGSISTNGLYVPPSSAPSPATVTVKATSVVDPTKSASANVAIVGAVAVLLSITPTSASVPFAGMQLFTASVTGTSNTAVTWGLSGAGCSGSSCGTLSTSSLSAVYLAPSVAPTPASVNVIATSVVDPTKSASANLIIVPAVVVGVTPANVSATAGATQQFAASVTGTLDTAVGWTVSGTGCSGTTCGTISSSGLYTAPVAVPSPVTVTITATSESDPSKSASADVTIVPPVGTTYYLAPASAGGNDSNNGLSPDAPWLSPNHSSLVCNLDTITAAAGTYSAANFGGHSWGTVTCPSGQGVVWLICSIFDACKLTAQAQPINGIAVGASYWGVQGWEVDGTTASGPCFFAHPNGSTTIHHIIFANDIASGCGLNGFDASNAGTVGVDYFAVVGSIAYNSAGGATWCGSGISIYQPVQSDSLPGTHIYVAGNFSFANLDGNPCAGGTPTDGEGIIFDAFDGSQGRLPAPYSAQAVADNNIVVANGGKGVEVFNNTAGPTHAAIYIRRNTTWGNNEGVDRDCGGCGEINIDTTSNVVAFDNLIQNTTDYAMSAVNLSDLTNQVYANFAYSAAGQNTFLYKAGSFTFGPSNTFDADPIFANPVAPGAPSCGGYSSVPACMATLIANFTPRNAAAVGFGYQIPSPTPVYDALFPQWLCNVNLPVGLVTMGCKPGP